MKTLRSKVDARQSARMPLFFIGLLFASSFVLTAFEWNVNYQSAYESSEIGLMRELPPEEVLVVARVKPPQPPPPPPRTHQIEIVDNTTEITASIDMGDLDFPDEPIIEEIQPIEEGDDLNGVLEGFKVDVPPSFPGGEAEIMNYLKNAIKYPTRARQNKIEGTVWIEFVVGKDGNIYDAKIVRGIGSGCDEEALKAVVQMPQWQPGKQKGIPVNVRFHLPVTFKLRAQ